jgi:hypothetical protein
MLKDVNEKKVGGGVFLFCFFFFFSSPELKAQVSYSDLLLSVCL